jgi:hypothetical protein
MPFCKVTLLMRTQYGKQAWFPVEMTKMKVARIVDWSGSQVEPARVPAELVLMQRAVIFGKKARRLEREVQMAVERR